jgi:hypothetical protein
MDAAHSISLSAKGLSHVQAGNDENDFTFYVGDSEYKCPWFTAEFLSPLIFALRQADSTLNTFRINTADPSCLFDSFLSLGRGLSTSVMGVQVDFLKSVSVELANSELYETLFRLFDKELNEKTVIDRLTRLECLGCSCDTELEFAASHFRLLRESELSTLSVSALSRILSHPVLVLEDENALYRVISSAVSRDRAANCLFEYVHFEYLSRERLSDFCGLVERDLDLLTVAVWSRLRVRLLESTMGFHLHYDGQSLDGIIAFLTREFGGNVHDLGIVTVSLSSLYRESYYGDGRRQVVDFTQFTLAHTENGPNSWVCYDFGEREVAVTHYTIRSRNDSSWHNLKTWTLEGLGSGDKWIPLDTRRDCEDLNGQGKFGTFPVSHREFVRQVRLTQTGVDSSGYHYLVLSAFELFGTLRPISIGKRPK